METKDYTILAFDQSSNMTGYSVYKNDDVISYGVLNLKDITRKTHNEVYYDEKVENNRQFLIRCIDFFKPDIVILEDIQKQSNIKTFKDLGYLFGVLKNYLYVEQIPFSIISPSAWRGELKIKGRKREDVKRNAQMYVKKHFDIDATEDEADAICISVASSQMLKNDTLIINKEG